MREVHLSGDKVTYPKSYWVNFADDDDGKGGHARSGAHQEVGIGTPGWF